MSIVHRGAADLRDNPSNIVLKETIENKMCDDQIIGARGKINLADVGVDELDVLASSSIDSLKPFTRQLDHPRTGLHTTDPRGGKLPHELL